MATMYGRTGPYSNSLKRGFERVEEMAQKMEVIVKNTDPSKLPPPIRPPQAGTPLDREDLRHFIQNAQPLAVESILRTAAPLLWRMNLAFAEAPNGSYFVTSDNPCVWFDPTAYRRPPFYRGVGLAMRDVEVTMPITPQFCAIVTHHKEIQGYLKFNDAQVQEMNRMTIAHCVEQFVAPNPTTILSWFDPGTLPPDAWENQQLT